MYWDLSSDFLCLESGVPRGACIDLFMDFALYRMRVLFLVINLCSDCSKHGHGAKRCYHILILKETLLCLLQMNFVVIEKCCKVFWFSLLSLF